MTAGERGGRTDWLADDIDDGIAGRVAVTFLRSFKASDLRHRFLPPPPTPTELVPPVPKTPRDAFFDFVDAIDRGLELVAEAFVRLRGL